MIRQAGTTAATKLVVQRENRSVLTVYASTETALEEAFTFLLLFLLDWVVLLDFLFLPGFSGVSCAGSAGAISTLFIDESFVTSLVVPASTSGSTTDIRVKV